MDTLRIGARESLQVQIRPGEKLPALMPGEMVRARVVELMPGGDALLRIKGNLIRTRSDLKLTPDTMVLLRVAEVKKEKGTQQIHLQVIETLPPAKPQNGLQNAGLAAVRELVRELAGLLGVERHRSVDFTAVIERLLKTLPDKGDALPNDLRGQLLTLLQISLRNAERSIHDRWRSGLSDPQLKDLPEWIQLLAAADELFAGVDQLRALPLKSLLGRTGVAFEAKMQAFATTMAEDSSSLGESTGDPLQAQGPSGAAASADLKGTLLELRQRILDVLGREQAEERSSANGRASPPQDAAAARIRSLEVLDGLLQDIEVFQLLSKVTDSFYTFLPLVWEGLREGEIAFKKSRGGGGLSRSYYCLLQLDFEDLGALNILALKQGGDFFVSFETDHEPLRLALQQNVSELVTMFRESGLNLKTADFHATHEKHLAPYEKLESFESILSVKI